MVEQQIDQLSLNYYDKAMKNSNPLITNVPRCNGFIYLGLPIGDDSFVEEFFTSKLYSLRTLGCRPITFIYRQFYIYSIYAFFKKILFKLD